MRVADTARTADAAAALADLAAGDEPLVDAAAGEIRLPVADSDRVGRGRAAPRRASGCAIAAVELQQPSLDDVFLTLTGRRAEDELTDRQLAGGRMTTTTDTPHPSGAA